MAVETEIQIATSRSRDAAAMKTTFSYLLSIALCGVTYAEVSDPPPLPEESVLEVTKVVLPLDSYAPRPNIEFKINGKGPFLFVLDTGAQGFVIDADLAKELKLPVVGKSAMGDPSDPQAIEVDRVRIESIDLGGVSLAGVVADSWDMPEQVRRHLRGRGVFGLNMLSAFLVTFDYPGSKIVIENGALPVSSDDNVLPWSAEDDGLPTVKISIQGNAFDAHIDSGSPNQITLPENVRGKFAYLEEPVVVGRGRTVNSEFEVWRGTIDGNGTLGSHVMENPDLHFVSMLNSTGYANIGSSLLRNFIVTFDQTSGLIRFASPRP